VGKLTSKARQAQAQHRTLRHELWQVTLVAWLLQNGNTFLDIGANVGLFSANLASFTRLDPSFRVIAFEPNPTVRARLKSAGTSDLFEVRDHALSEGEPSTVPLYLSVGSGQSSLEPSSKNSAVGSTSVEARPLGPILADIAPTTTGIVIKVDVEGHELAVLRGAGDELSPERKVHSVLLDDFARDHEDEIIELFGTRGYRLVNAQTLEPYQTGDYALLATTRDLP
jgi:FkbM family methyltransferase